MIDPDDYFPRIFDPNRLAPKPRRRKPKRIRKAAEQAKVIRRKAVAR
jgi:hypothetical protein